MAVDCMWQQSQYPQGCTGACGCWNGCWGHGYTADEWDVYGKTLEGQNTYRWWADWIPTPAGQQWCANKRWEARRVVDGMIQQWGLQALQAGEGVIDIGGDPGFVAAELLRSGIRVTVVDPAFGVSGKANPMTSEVLRHFGQNQLRLIRQPFNQAFVDNPAYAGLLGQATALVSLYPDEATDFCLCFSAFSSMRTALIPCNECRQYFPPHDPTYEGFVNQLLARDCHYARFFGNPVLLRRERICNTPYCQVILQRTPAPLGSSWQNPCIYSPPGPCTANGEPSVEGEDAKTN